MRIQIVYNELSRHNTKHYHDRRDEAIDYVVVHHSASPAKKPREGWLETVHQIAVYHVHDLGWPGIGYHFVIAPDGQIFKTQPISKSTYHARSLGNRHGIGVCLLGNFENHCVPPPQYQALCELAQAIKTVMPEVKHAIGHRDVPRCKTACPGENMTDDMIAAVMG